MPYLQKYGRLVAFKPKAEQKDVGRVQLAEPEIHEIRMDSTIFYGVNNLYWIEKCKEQICRLLTLYPGHR